MASSADEPIAPLTPFKLKGGVINQPLSRPSHMALNAHFLHLIQQLRQLRGSSLTLTSIHLPEDTIRWYETLVGSIKDGKPEEELEEIKGYFAAFDTKAKDEIRELREELDGQEKKYRERGERDEFGNAREKNIAKEKVGKREKTGKKGKDEWVLLAEDGESGSESESESEGDEAFFYALNMRDIQEANLQIQRLESLRTSIEKTLTNIFPGLPTLLVPSPAAEPQQSTTSEITTKTTPQFNGPLTITDFLDRTFPFPSEFSLTELHALIKARFSAGPGAKHIQAGQYELLLTGSEAEEVIEKAEDLKPGMKLTIVLVVDGLPIPKNGVGVCLFPGCGSRDLVDGASVNGISCLSCQKSFIIAPAPIPQPTTLSTGEILALSKTSVRLESDNLYGSSLPVDTPPAQVPSLPHKLSEPHQLEDEYRDVKFVKIHGLTDLSALGKVYKCVECDNHLAVQEDILSRNFRGLHGRATLLSSLYNITRGPSTPRNMTTGLHQICDVYCRQCATCVGWLYEHAVASAERYKIGRFILENELVVDVDGRKLGREKARLMSGGVRVVGVEEQGSEANTTRERSSTVEEEEKATRGDGGRWRSSFYLKHTATSTSSSLTPNNQTQPQTQQIQQFDFLSKVRTVKGELLGLEDLEAKLKALMDAEEKNCEDREELTNVNGFLDPTVWS